MCSKSKTKIFNLSVPTFAFSVPLPIYPGDAKFTIETSSKAKIHLSSHGSFSMLFPSLSKFSFTSISSLEYKTDLLWWMWNQTNRMRVKILLLGINKSKSSFSVFKIHVLMHSSSLSGNVVPRSLHDSREKRMTCAIQTSGC